MVRSVKVYKKMKKQIIEHNKTVLDAITQLNECSDKFLIITKNKKVVGTLTDGDVRRGTISGVDLASNVFDICNKSFTFGKNSNSEISNQKLLKSIGSYFLPILNEKFELVDVLVDSVDFKLKKVDALALILAGGLGKRMGSLTRNSPKPLLEVDKKPLIEHILENLSLNGFTDVVVSTYYQAEKIINKIGDGEKYGLNIEYIIEEKPLGTFGPVKLINKQFNNLLLINGDVLTRLKLNKIVEHHVSRKSDITLGVIPYFLNVPFGVLDFDDNTFIEIIEKPEYKHFVNSGINVFSKKSLEHLQENAVKIDLPEFVNSYQNKKLISKFDIKDYWIDVGTPESLKKAMNEWSDSAE
jgi:dTDP-glucose pyrophosphorylase